MNTSKAIVVGAGIVGLATARALALKGYAVTVIERTEKAVGASIRNFGMVWPIGQPSGNLYERALKSRFIWTAIADSIHLWYDECGSLHTAYFEDEWIVLNELYEVFKAEGRPVSLLSKETITQRYKGINEQNLLGGLHSETEVIVDPRDAIQKIALYLQEQLNVHFIWNTNVIGVNEQSVFTPQKTYQADVVCVCSGADFETLFAKEFNQLPITKCKLQMMRFSSSERIGTSLCGGLSLIHYSSFKAAPSLAKLKERYENEMSEYLSNGIHVMVSQNQLGELTVGDSHEYGLTHEPFDSHSINQLVLNYLQQFCKTSNWKLLQTWNGIYPKLTNSATDICLNPMPGVFILNGLGGAGMTLSFGFAEEMVKAHM
jgi:FAD dependent oxidoreductase TIGR03364